MRALALRLEACVFDGVGSETGRDEKLTRKEIDDFV